MVDGTRSRQTFQALRVKRIGQHALCVLYFTHYLMEGIIQKKGTTMVWVIGFMAVMFVSIAVDAAFIASYED